jgi:hypothetical protein
MVEAMNYLSAAAALNSASSNDARLPEIDQRLTALTARIVTGDMGQNVRNDIQRRNAWVKLLAEAQTFYNKNPYFNVVYSTIPQQGRIDYNRNTVEISFNIWPEVNEGRVHAVYNIVNALWNTGKQQEWGLSEMYLLGNYQNKGDIYYRFYISAELFDENGKILAATRVNNSIQAIWAWNSSSGAYESIYMQPGRISFTGNAADIGESFTLRSTTTLTATDKSTPQQYFSGVPGYGFSYSDIVYRFR